MTDDFSTTLSWFAGYSNFYSVISVLICFCIMVVFILRLNGDHFMSSSATHYNTPKEQPMSKLHNPFSIQLSEGKISSLKDGLYLDICMKTVSRTDIFWGVNIQTFQMEIHKPVTEIYNRLISNESFDVNYLHQVNLGDIEETDRPCEFYSKSPETVTESGLGSPPRQLYPVVVASVMRNREVAEVDHTVVVQFTIIHLKDSVCPLDSHIVYQFVKTNQNNLLSLQPIFLSSTEHDFSGSNITRSGSEASTANTTNCDKCGLLKQNADKTIMGQDSSVCSCNSDNTSSEPKCKEKEMPEAEKSDRNGAIKNSTTHERNENAEDIKRDSETNIDEMDVDILEADDDISLDETNTCIICQSAVIYYTLLPCRHACVCVSCVRLVDKCPMCRSYIDAFFRLYDLNSRCEFTVGESDYHVDTNVPAATIWEAINQRLNEMFGFA